ncbi:hypothetical protein BDV98DRAFT_607263 [Pterulicium gracile]|uniref:Uncharacterized protein n=1 Tax=Pterulicium gracile TaxID=1884261 RepID=A0A5C3QCX2_9AGAR|nr:hypothetical protein BDV98DRAFT_607263 [Pterula gracilis]
MGEVMEEIDIDEGDDGDQERGSRYHTGEFNGERQPHESSQRADDGQKQDANWAPFGSKTASVSINNISYVVLFDSLPYLRLSDDHLRMFLFILRELHVPNVPSFDAVRKTQESLSPKVAIVPRHHVSSLGNNLFVDHPLNLVKLDFANPHARGAGKLHVYPAITKKVSQLWHADKWLREVPNDQPSLTWSSIDSRWYLYFVDEIAELKGQRFIHVERWLEVDDVVHAEGRMVVKTGEGATTAEMTSPGQILKIITADVKRPNSQCFVVVREYAVRSTPHARFNNFQAASKFHVFPSFILTSFPLLISFDWLP